jgi:hypothetical protein
MRPEFKRRHAGSCAARGSSLHRGGRAGAAARDAAPAAWQRAATLSAPVVPQRSAVMRHAAARAAAPARRLRSLGAAPGADAARAVSCLCVLAGAYDM